MKILKILFYFIANGVKFRKVVEQGLPVLHHSVVSLRFDDMSLVWPAVVQLLVFIYSGIQ